LGSPHSLVGYSVRLDSKVSHTTRLTFVTTGVLLRRLETDPALQGVSHIVVDEVHERSMDSDFLLILLRRLCRRRSDLKIVLMSATADADRFSKYFLGLDGGLSLTSPPILTVQGRMFPVQTFFLEDAIENSGFSIEMGSEYAKYDVKGKSRDIASFKISGSKGKVGTSVHVNMKDVSYAASQMSVKDKNKLNGIERELENDEDNDGEEDENYDIDANNYSESTYSTISKMNLKVVDLDLVEKVIRHVAATATDVDGSILVFLPGLAEIRKLYDRLTSEHVRDNRKQNLYVLPLHSLLAVSEQTKGN
jgi:ATP-dependent RNA helicase DHX29